MRTIDTPLFTVVDTRTGKPADDEWIARTEEWAKGLIYCDMEGWYVSEHGEIALLDECGSFRWQDDRYEERYELRWNLDALKELVAKLEAGDAE